MVLYFVPKIHPKNKKTTWNPPTRPACIAVWRRFAMCWASPSPESQRSKALCWQRWNSCASAPGGGSIRHGSSMPNLTIHRWTLIHWYTFYRVMEFMESFWRYDILIYFYLYMVYDFWFWSIIRIHRRLLSTQLSNFGPKQYWSKPLDHPKDEVPQ